MTWALLILGIVACSSSVIFIKGTAMDPSYLAGIRLLLAGSFLLPFFIRDLKKHPEIRLKKLILSSLPAAFFLAAHFISWNFGLRRTLGAHGTLIVNMVPLVLPFLLWMTHRESVNRVEIVATLVSLLGLGVLAFNDYHFSRDHVLGDLVCFGSMLMFAAYLAFGRKNKDSKSVFVYIVPVYFCSSFMCLAVSFVQFEKIMDNQPYDYFMAFLLALIPGTLGHTLINYAMRHLRGQIVGVVNVGQFLSAGVFSYFCFGEIPQATFYIVSLFIVASCVVAILSHRSERSSA